MATPPGQRDAEESFRNAIPSPTDLQSLERFLEVYRPYLRGVADQLLPGELRARVDGSDLVQEALLRGTSRLDQFRGKTDDEFAGWLRQILEHLVVDWVRHHTADKRDVRRETAPEGPQPSPAETPSGVLSSKEEAIRVSEAMRQLSDEQRQAVEMRSRGLDFQEIGRTTDRSADAARMLWGRAIRRLTDLLKGQG